MEPSESSSLEKEGAKRLQALSKEAVIANLNRVMFLPGNRRFLFWAALLNGLLIIAQPVLDHFHFHKFGLWPVLIALGLAFISSPFYILLASGIQPREFRIDIKKWPSAKALAILAASLFLQWLMSTCIYWTSSDTMIHAINLALLSGVLFPISGALSFFAGEWIRRRLQHLGAGMAPIKQSFVTRFGKRLGKSLLVTATQVWPYLSFYTGFLLSSLLVFFLPDGVGTTFGNWLLATLVDANITAVNSNPLLLSLLSSAVLSLTLIGVFSPFVIRLSAGYQDLLRALFTNRSGDDFLSIFSRTMEARVVKIPLRSAHPHLRSAIETLIYISLCYTFLFSLIAFLPTSTDGFSPLLVPLISVSSAIWGWLGASLYDANITAPLTANLRCFIAAYVAACATVPFAVSSCAFLPARKESQLLFSKQGVLLPGSFGRKLHFWSELKRVSVDKLGKKDQIIRLKFAAKTIKLCRSELEPEALAELLALADEQAEDCKIDQSAIALRSSLSREINTSSLAETKNFESTIFVPHLAGEFIHEGAYRVIRKLSSKPLNAVYLVRKSDGELAVLKQFVTPSSNQKSIKQKDLFLNECKLLTALNHPSLVKVIDSFESDGSCYIALEHIKGSDLRMLIKANGPRKEKLVISWAKEICQQLAYLHKQSPAILHRDLSPDNLMLDEFGHLRIIDFGAAHQFMEGVTGTLIGKQSYIAPEQLRGKPSTKSDIYSLGASIFYMLTAEDPRALQPSDLERADLTVSKDLLALVRTCTAFDEEERPASIDEVLASLDAIETGGKSITLSTHDQGVLLDISQKDAVGKHEEKNS